MSKLFPLSLCLTVSQTWSSQKVMVSGHTYCVTQFGTEKKKVAISLEWGAFTPPYKKDKGKQERMTGRVGEKKTILSDQMSSTGRDICDLITILLARPPLGSYDDCRWGSAEQGWSCEHNWVFHTPSQFTPYLSLVLSLELVRESCSKWTICSICSKINYFPCKPCRKWFLGYARNA